MAPRRTRKQPVTATVKASTVSHKQTQATISTFHTLLKRRSTLQRQLGKLPEGKRDDDLEGQLCDVEKQISDLGGIDAYQHASTLGQSSERGGDSSKVLTAWLRELGRHKAVPPLRWVVVASSRSLTPECWR